MYSRMPSDNNTQLKVSVDLFFSSSFTSPLPRLARQGCLISAGQRSQDRRKKGILLDGLPEDQILLPDMSVQYYIDRLVYIRKSGIRYRGSKIPRIKPLAFPGSLSSLELMGLRLRLASTRSPVYDQSHTPGRLEHSQWYHKTVQNQDTASPTLVGGMSKFNRGKVPTIIVTGNGGQV